MNPWLSFAIGIFSGGVLSWFFAKKVYDVSEHAFMTVRGYVYNGEAWIKSEAGKLRNAL